MNYIWCGMIIISIIVSVINGCAEETITAGFEGAKSAVFTILSIAGLISFWTGFMKIADSAGIMEKVQKLLKPVTKFLFPKAGEEAKKYISMNMSANLLGMGNAATPMGIKAMQCLDKENKNPAYASDDMCMLVILNTTSLQLIPTTIIALRSAAGSQDPFSIILPIWISSFTAAAFAVTMAKICFRRKRKL